MKKETKQEIEIGIPGIGKAKYSQTNSTTKTKFSYSCDVIFDSHDAAMEFRNLVEKAATDVQGEMNKSHFDTIEIPN